MLKVSLTPIGFYFNLKLFGFETGFHLYQFWYGVKYTIGIRNSCYDGKRVIFLDYDDTLLDDMLIPELRYLQKKYSLGDFYIFKSSQKKNSYHAVCFDKVSVYECQSIVMDSSCDEAYKNIKLKDFRTYVLRVAPKGSSAKPKFLKRLNMPGNKQVSFSHFKFFKFNYDLPDAPDWYDFDDSKDVNIVEYATKNYLTEVK